MLEPCRSHATNNSPALKQHNEETVMRSPNPFMPNLGNTLTLASIGRGKSTLIASLLINKEVNHV
ncbi:hypothetical protein Sps_04684 [Shewanella psychrophila]|uniref:Uncharacterized protein n=1 Tax=Shewanella psychrophila TaxID=225848 RepID=A0A1S6HW14_9GAMM|nr:hypothetical protein [Shewanella psychrophila]AQS39767.1 hypothetical protein Sps_04684 [Shewanella psychrophila]